LVRIKYNLHNFVFMILHRFNYATKTEAQTSSYEILSCEIPAGQPVAPCGTFMNYDAVNNKLAPTVNGFKAGTYADGSSVYVGLGNNSACFAESMAPCRIKPSDPGAGCYIAGCNTERYETTTVQYLLNHPRLRWVGVTSSTLTATSGVTYDVQNVATFKFARIASTANGVNYVTIGKGIQYALYNPNFHGAWW
jgi:hypothetical protein